MPDLVLTRAAVRELDRRAIEDHGVPSMLLMENAGRACAEEALAMLACAPATEAPEAPEAPAVVLCGPGNNGGDGLVIARTLFNRGVTVRVFFVGPIEKLDAGSADVRLNARLWRDLGQPIAGVEANTMGDLAAELPSAALVVDALFGTGLARPLRDPWAEAVRAVNACGRPVLAVDLPSGLDADTGEVLGAAVRAEVTVSFVARKPGFALGAGPELCGRVVVAEIGIPRPLLESVAP